MRRLIIVGLAVVASLAAAPAANASTGDRCGGWLEANRGGELLLVDDVRPMSGMNCASSRYVVNKWIKRAWRSRYDRVLSIRSFSDGYVRWYCHKRSRLRWRCDEYDSGTSFTFRAF